MTSTLTLPADLAFDLHSNAPASGITQPHNAAKTTNGFTSGRPDWDVPYEHEGVIDLHICIPKDAGVTALKVIELVAHFAQVLLPEVQKQVPKATLHTGLRNNQYEIGCQGKPSWAERLIHAAVTQRFAEMTLPADQTLSSTCDQSRSALPQPLVRCKCLEQYASGGHQSLSETSSSQESGGSVR